MINNDPYSCRETLGRESLVLGGGANKTNKGYIEGGGYIVSWCVGHLVGLKNPNEYGCGWEQKWSFSQLPMIPEAWQFEVTEAQQRYQSGRTGSFELQLRQQKL